MQLALDNKEIKNLSPEELGKAYLSFEDCDQLFAPLIPNSPFIKWTSRQSRSDYHSLLRLVGLIVLIVEIPFRYIATFALHLPISCYSWIDPDIAAYWQFRLSINQDAPLHCLSGFVYNLI